MVREIKNWTLKEMLIKAGYGKIRLYKDNGFFFICDDEPGGLCERMESQCIWICHFCQLTPRKWADIIIDMCNEVKDKD